MNTVKCPRCGARMRNVCPECGLSFWVNQHGIDALTAAEFCILRDWMEGAECPEEKLCKHCGKKPVSFSHVSAHIISNGTVHLGYSGTSDLCGDCEELSKRCYDAKNRAQARHLEIAQRARARITEMVDAAKADASCPCCGNIDYYGEQEVLDNVKDTAEYKELVATSVLASRRMREIAARIDRFHASEIEKRRKQ